MASNTKKEINILLRTDMDIGNAAKEADKLKQVFSKISLPAENETKINKLFNNLNDEIVKYQNKLKSGFKTKTDVTGLENTGKNINRIFEQINSEFGKVQKMDLGEIFKIDPKVQEEINKINQEIEKYRKNLSELGKKNNLPDLTNFQNQLKTKGAKDNSKKVFDLIDEGEYQKALELIQKLQNEYSKLVVQYQTQGKNTANVEANAKAFDDLGNSVKGVISQAGELNQKINNLEVQKTDKITQELTNVQTSINGAADGFNRLTNETKGYISVGNAAVNETQQLNKELSDIQNKVSYFFSLTNSVNLLKRTIRSAYNTVKELDAAMTETAVVTDFSVGDMWDQLPRYTKAANELGTTTLGAYQTMTLFYQQGLKTNEVFEIGTETMKMARIAGMDYADATNKMTAALRGFNMELNETSAQRVNDVYSELAAITAADTNEIATAMTKTASIADSANMEFETTAAFLSQIIETTRESAETAGTAMKTVIARFQELKKDPAEIGEVDGEIVDANKIETALRTINVALRDTSGQFRDLDDVFIEIASKWNTLDTNTQRYIATMAAGSRQQSRFIAMMSNYDRTMELVNAANNSAGASQRQFEKTTESLESKLNKLKNAWDAFTMGLTNSEVIKFGVDLLTNFLTTINKLIDGISGGNGLIKSILSLGIAFGGLKIGKNLIIGLSSDIAKVFKNAGKEGASAWNDGIISGFKSSGKNIQKTVKNIFSKDFWSSNFKGIFESDKPFDDLLKNVNIDVLKADIDIAEELGDFEEVTRLKTELAKSEEYYSKILNTSQSQQIAYNAAVRAGIPLDQAESILTAKQSKEELALALARKAGKTAADDETRAQASLIIAEQTHLQFLKMGLLQKAKYIGIALFSTGQKKKEAIITLGLAKAEGSAAIATSTLGKAMLALPIGWIVAGLALVAGAIYAIWKASPAQQLKEAQEAAEQAATAADELADKYNNLKTALDEIGEKKDNLEELTKGTQEWRDAVFELNQQVLQLMKDFPELAAFVKNVDGVLTINYDKSIGGQTANDIVDSAYEQQVRASSAAISAELKVIEKELTVEHSDLGLYYTSTMMEGASAVAPRQVTELLSQAITNGELTGLKDSDKVEDINSNREIIEQFLKDSGYEYLTEYGSTLSSVYASNIEELKAFGVSIHEAEVRTNSYYSALSANADQIANLKGLGYNQEQIDAASAYSEIISGAISQQFEKVKAYDWWNRANSEKLVEEYTEIMGYKSGKLGFFGGSATFKDAEGNEQTVSLEDISQQVAGSATTEELAKKQKAFSQTINDLEENINKVSKGIGTAIRNVYSGTEGNALNYSDLLSFKSDNVDVTDGITDEEKVLLNEELSAVLENLTDEQKSLLESLFGDLDTFSTTVVNSLEISAEKFNKAKENLAALRLDNLALDPSVFNFDTSTISGFSDTILKIYTASGREKTGEFKEQIDAILSQLDPELAEKFIGALNGLDFSSVDSIEGFSEKLLALGIDLTDCGVNVEDLEVQLIDLSGAVREVDFESIIEQITKLSELRIDLETGEKGRQFTAEEKDTLIATGIDEDNFVFNVDEGTWNYIGESTNEIVAAIEKQTSELLGTGPLEQQIASGDAFEQAKNITTISEDTLYGKLLRLKEYQNIMSKQGYDVGYDATELQNLYDKAVRGGSQADKDAIASQFQTWLDAARQDWISYDANNRTKSQLEGIQPYSSDYSFTQAALAEEETWDAVNNKVKYSDTGYTKALLSQAANYGTLNDEIAEYIEAVRSGDEETAKAKKQQLAFAVSVEELAKKFDQLDDEAEGHLQALEKMDKESDEYRETLDDLAEDVNRALGTDIDGTFFDEENLKLFKKALEGDQDAWEQFIINADVARLSMADFAEQFQLSAEDINGITAALDGLEFDINGRADMSQVVEALFAAGMTGQQVAEFLEKLGYTNIEFTVDNQLKNLEDIANPEEWAKVQGTITLEATKKEIPAARRLSSFGSGGRNSGSKKSSSGGGSSKSWENPYDKFYNLTETINKNLREREKLERTYNKLLREQQHILNTIDYEKNLSDQISNLKQQADKLRREYALQSTMYSGKGNELQSYMAKNSSMRKYGYYDAASQQIVIDWNAINKVKNDEKGQKIEDYIGKLEELRDAMWDAEDAMLDAEEQIEEMKEDLREKLEELKQAYLDFEDRIVEALVAQRQAEIDELQEVYDLMSESNNSVLSAIQEVISEQRRLRELEEQKADIEEMQRRLAMLRQDTSGASDLEIKALEEQIGDAQQSYTDSLIDQAIDEMGTANEKAEEQRQQQIDLLQHQLDWDKENGKFWAQVNELLSTAINPDGSLNNNSPLVELLKSTEGYKAMSEFGKQNWWTNLQKTVAEAMAGLKEWLNPTDVDAAIGGIQGGDTGIVGGIGSDDGGSGGSGGSGGGSGVLARGENVKTLQRFLKKHWGKNIDDDGLYGSKTKKAVKEIQKTLNDSGAVAGGRIQEDGLYGADTQNAIRLFYSRTGRSNIAIPAPMFKTGGLADFTGPAWLDGTKTHPEIVLNARDTANFLELRDILRDMNLISEGKTSGGDNYFEIHIEVDTLSNDYDVEQVADKVKRIINDDARYRNTNAINLIR